MKNMLTFLLVIAVALSCGQAPRQGEGLSKTESKNDLPDFKVTLMDGTQKQFKELQGNIALVLFQPDCDHCQREAEDIRRNLGGFKDFKLYFVSAAPVSDIVSFANHYRLAAEEQVVFARTEASDIVQAFGPLEVPSLYLYSNNGELIHAFNGEVAIEVVLKYIN